MKALTNTDFHFDGQKSVYHGKVRDVYNINDDLLVMVATDRISAFDVVLPKGIPFKGQVLNQIAAKFLDTTTDICPNWKLATPDPMVTVGLKCEGFRVEMIIRSILTGSAWRDYKKGVREICGVKLPDGMRENERFPEPIITPTTKADEGHDMNISKEEIIAQGIVSKEDYEVMEDYTRKIFARGQEIAARQGLILVEYQAGNNQRFAPVFFCQFLPAVDKRPHMRIADPEVRRLLPSVRIIYPYISRTVRPFRVQPRPALLHPQPDIGTLCLFIYQCTGFFIQVGPVFTVQGDLRFDCQRLRVIQRNAVAAHDSDGGTVR